MQVPQPEMDLDAPMHPSHRRESVGDSVDAVCPDDVVATSTDQLELVVKNPYKQSSPFSCHVCLDNTILDLKKRLQISYSGNPSPEEQRIVFSGKIYEDKTVLREIFDKCKHEKPMTCHLIVSSHLNVSQQMDEVDLPYRRNENSVPSQPQTDRNLEQQPLPHVVSDPPQSGSSMNPRILEPQTVETNVHNPTQLQHYQNLLQQQQIAHLEFLGAVERIKTEIRLLSDRDSKEISGVGDGTASMKEMVSGGQGPTMSGFASWNTNEADSDECKESNSKFIRDTKPEESHAIQDGDQPKDSNGSDVESEKYPSTKPFQRPDSPLENLVRSHEKLVQTMRISQQLQALASPVISMPQPLISYHNYLRMYQYQRSDYYSREEGETERNHSGGNNNADVTPTLDQTDLNPENDIQQNEAPADQQGFRRVIAVNINLGLILKLTIFVYLLVGDGNGSMNKLLWVAGTAAFYYVYEIGFLTYLFGRELSLESLLDHFGQTRLAQIPPGDRYEGFGTDVTVLIKSFVLSLIPSWHPVQYPEEGNAQDQ